MDPRTTLDARLRPMTVIWMALSAAQLIAGVVVYVVLTVGGMELQSLSPSLMTFLAPAMLALMAGGLVLGHQLERRVPAEAADDAKLQAYFSARLVAMAMQEGPALAVIVMSLLAGLRNLAAAGAAVGVWTTFLARPRRDAAERLLRSGGSA